MFQTGFYLFSYLQENIHNLFLDVGLICIQSAAQILNVQLDEFLYKNMFVGSITSFLKKVFILRERGKEGEQEQEKH